MTVFRKPLTKQTLRSGNNEFSGSDSCVIYPHRGSNAEAGRKLAEGFSGSYSREDSADQGLGDSPCGAACFHFY